MTTNEILAILEAMKQQQQSIPINWTQVMMGIIGCVMAYQTYLAQRTHTAVNSTKTAMEARIEGLEKRIISLTGDNASKDERIRGQQDKDNLRISRMTGQQDRMMSGQQMVAVPAAVVSTVAVVPAVPAAAPATTPTASAARMGAAITELADAAKETKEQSQTTTDLAKKTEALAKEATK